MLQALFLYPVAFPQLIRDSVLVARDGRLTQAAINKSNLFGLMFMFVGILSLITFTIVIKINRASLRRLAIALPFLSSLCFGAQLTLCILWHRRAQEEQAGAGGESDPRQAYFQQ